MKILLIFVFYGLLYYVVESLFYFVTVDLLDRKNPKTFRQRIRAVASLTSSFWMIPVGSIGGLLLNLFFRIPFNYNNIGIFILVCVLGSLILTGMELLSGLVLNRIFKLDLWRYTTSINLFGKNIRLNFMNQIDLPHSLLWIWITFIFFFINKLF